MIKPKHINYIDIELMEKMCHPIAVALFDSKIDPITAFSSHNKERLEAVLDSPKATFDGKELYPTITKKTAILYYNLIKGHCFENGNKRTATATLIVFLYINNFLIGGNKKKIEDFLFNLAKEVASSKGNDDMHKFLLYIEQWLNNHIVLNLNIDE